jgi:hypothetical protein
VARRTSWASGAVEAHDHHHEHHKRQHDKERPFERLGLKSRGHVPLHTPYITHEAGDERNQHQHRQEATHTNPLQVLRESHPDRAAHQKCRGIANQGQQTG